MNLILALSVVTVVIPWKADSQFTREVEGETGDQMKCIYHNMEYVNCTWKPSEEAAPGDNDLFYYWFTRKMYTRRCTANEGKQSCVLRYRTGTFNWLCLYIETSNDQTVTPMNCFQLQEHGPNRLVLNGTSPYVLDCLYSGDNCFNCSLEQGKDAMQNIRYKVHYKFEKHMPVKQCRQYLQHGNHNIGCHFTIDAITSTYKKLYVYVIDDNNRIRIRPQIFLLGENVKMSPPRNLTAKLIGNETLFLMWDVPRKNVLNYFQYEMKYRSNLDSKWKRKLVPDRSFSLTNVDPAKCYFFRLRFMIHEDYAGRGYWSEWGPALIWKGKSVVESCPVPGMRMAFLAFLPATALVSAIFVCVLCRMKRVRTMFYPGIPDPKHVFVDLFDEYNGNFQEWIGASKNLNVDCQSNCAPVECRIEVEAVRVKTECEDCPAEMSESNGLAAESRNENSESSGEDASTCTNQLLVHKTDTLNMSAIVMDANMYIRL